MADRLYARLGPRIIFAVVWLNGAIFLGAVLVSLAWTSRYLGVSGPDFLKAVALALVLVPLIVTVTFRRQMYDVVRPGLSWAGDPAQAQAVWASGVRSYGDRTRIALRADVVALVPPAILLALLTHQPWYGAVAYYVSLFVAVLASAVLWMFGGDLLMRPMMRDVARHLPPDFEPPGTGVRLRTKALAPLPVVTLFGALTAGAFVDLVDNGALRLAVAVGIALATAGAASVIFWVVTRSALDPLDELLAATKQAADGQLGTRVPVVTDDDLGFLTAGFNRMLAQLEANTEELRASRARIVAASDAERRRVERNIHDGAQQQLVGLALKLKLLEERAGDVTLRADLAEAGERLKDALAELRELAHGLHPTVLTTDGLSAAVEQLASRTPVPVTIAANGDRFPETVESTAYFVVSEALANVAKYARASRADVTLARRNGSLHVEVSDDGVGGADPHAGSGLAGLQDRVAALDGHLTVESHAGTGTRVTAELPLA